MKKLEIIRVENLDTHTVGVVLLAGEVIAMSMENPWLDNIKNESCIPEGEYIAERHISPRYGECFMLRDVPDRSYILIHPGNYVENTDGCILLGNRVRYNNGRRMVANSRQTVDDFMARLKGLDEIKINIRRLI